MFNHVLVSNLKAFHVEIPWYVDLHTSFVNVEACNLRTKEDFVCKLSSISYSLDFALASLSAFNLSDKKHTNLRK